jgi:small-conductance mechanosensitive channel
MPTLFKHALSDFFDPSNILGVVTYGVLLLLLAMLGSRLVKVVASQGKAHFTDRTALNFVTQFLRVCVFLVAFIVYCHVIPELRSLGTTLLAGAGVASVILGLAAQTALGNLIAGFSLLLYRPFRVGGHLQVNTTAGSVSGTVQTLSLGHTVLKGEDGKTMIVPNSIISNTLLIRSETPPK